MRDTTLAGAVIGQDSLLKQAALVLGGTMFIALAAQVSIPFFPVPLTLQTLAILQVQPRPRAWPLLWPSA